MDRVDKAIYRVINLIYGEGVYYTRIKKYNVWVDYIEERECYRITFEGYAEKCFDKWVLETKGKFDKKKADRVVKTMLLEVEQLKRKYMPGEEWEEDEEE